jgi:hypothetical protein
MGSVDYFCYISRTKVDQLYESVDPDAVDEWTERQSRQRNLDAKASAGLSLAGIAELFRGEVGYGSQVASEREQKVRVKVVKKLGVVLTAIAAERGEIPALAECLRTDTFPLYIHHLGAFRVTEPVRDPTLNQVVTLRSEIGGESLLLDCSLRFFSETDDSGKLWVHSGNHHFFEGVLPMTLETVFVFLHRQAGEVFGSPLYLRLTTDVDWFREQLV